MILSFNGHDITKVRDLPLVVARDAGRAEGARSRCWRNGQQTASMSAIAEMPDNPKQVAKNERGDDQSAQADNTTAMGVKLAPLNEQLRRQAQVPKNVKGVVVTAVADDSPLAALGIQPGDVIQSINQQPVTTPTAGREQAEGSTGEQEDGAVADQSARHQRVPRAVAGERR